MRAAALTLTLLILLVCGLGEGHASSAAFTGTIVFERDPGQGSDIYVSTAPRRATPLVATDAQEFDPALHRDGRVAFARADGDTSEIYVLAGGNVTPTTRDSGVAQHPAWSPKGDRIAYSSDRGNGAELMEVRVGQPETARPIAPASGDDLTPSYARDGRIGFASNRAGGFDLYVVDRAGKVTRLTRDPATELSPAWSPDASRIAYTRVDAKGNADVWLLNVATRQSTPLTTTPSDESDPSFSPDGAQVAFVSDRGGTPAIWTMPAKRGARATPFSGATEAVDLGPQWGSRAPRAAQQRSPSAASESITCPTSGPFAGTAGADNIPGTSSSDTICGRAGADTINGNDGNDKLSGGDGADKVHGNNHGDPIVSGGRHADEIYGESGDDKLFARDGVRDSLFGGTGFDRAQRDAVDVRSSVEGTIA